MEKLIILLFEIFGILVLLVFNLGLLILLGDIVSSIINKIKKRGDNYE